MYKTLYFSAAEGSSTTSRVWSANFNNIAITKSSPPSAHVWKWEGDRFGTKYADHVSAGGSSSVVSVKFSPDGKAVFLGHNGGLTIYKWTPNGFSDRYSGVPTTFTIDVNPSANITSLAFNPAGDVVFIGLFGNPQIVAYKWDSNIGLGTRYTDLASGVRPIPNKLNINVKDIKVSHDGKFVGTISTDGTSFWCSIYNWSDVTGFGTKIFNKPNAYNSMTFHPNNTEFVFASPSSIQQWTFSGTQYTSLTPFAFGELSAGVAFSPDGKALFVLSNKAPYIRAYKWIVGSGAGQKYDDPTIPMPTLGTTTDKVTSLVLSPDGKSVAITVTRKSLSSTYSTLHVYGWDSDVGFVTKYDAPIPVPSEYADGTQCVDIN